MRKEQLTFDDIVTSYNHYINNHLTVIKLALYRIDKSNSISNKQVADALEKIDKSNNAISTFLKFMTENEDFKVEEYFKKSKSKLVKTPEKA